MSQDIEVGTEVYTPVEYGEGRIYGKVTAEGEPKGGKRVVTVRWVDGDVTEEFADYLKVDET